MTDFGRSLKAIADHPQYRWLGSHKGMVHLALASLTNACFDLWAKSRGVPLWRLLLDLAPEQIVNLLDLSYLQGCWGVQRRWKCCEKRWVDAPNENRS